jgi:hypothetical protein
MIEAHHLTDDKGNVGYCVGQEIQQHSDDGWVTPGLFHMPYSNLSSNSKSQIAIPP